MAKDIPTTDSEFVVQQPAASGSPIALAQTQTHDYVLDKLEQYRDNLNELKWRRQKGGVYFYRPEPALNQDKFLRAHADHKILMFLGGNRSGKTETGAASLCAAAIGRHRYWKPASHRKIFWVVSVDHKVAMRAAMQKIFKLIPQDEVKRYYKVEKILKLKDGTEIEFKSVANGRESMQGADVDGVWIDEECPEDVFNELYARTIDRSGKILITMTPLLGITWVHEELYQKSHMDGGLDDEIAFFHADPRKNPHLPPKEVAKWEAKMSLDEKRMRLEGKFISLSGHIFGTELAREDPTVAGAIDIPYYWKKGRALDAGTRNPAAVVWGAVDESGTIYIYDEYQEPNRPTSWHAKEIIKRSGHEWEGISVCDPSAAQWKLDLGMAGIGFEDADNDVTNGILNLKGLLWNGRLKILPGCTELIKQLKKYQWKPQARRSGEDGKPAPLKKDDHLIDAVRYLCMEFRGITSEAPPVGQNEDGVTIEYYEDIFRQQALQGQGYGSNAWEDRMRSEYGGY